ncbi:hypothetical protein BDP27DRAFT_608398 [Rhodocollybia butyracea]|uniref:Uncharacterized protein n=1 Tax=Rhodocollybia butyracea TaxID=206335 RepID=A0A9P5Q9J1_9AGAR|nr:hypothetical protein BDP27DRAFT_608398 [Rhodocollybia butyracea]
MSSSEPAPTSTLMPSFTVAMVFDGYTCFTASALEYRCASRCKDTSWLRRRDGRYRDFQQGNLFGFGLDLEEPPAGCRSGSGFGPYREGKAVFVLDGEKRNLPMVRPRTEGRAFELYCKNCTCRRKRNCTWLIVTAYRIEETLHSLTTSCKSRAQAFKLSS